MSNVHAILATVRRRLRLRSSVNAATVGLAVGCFVALMLAMVSVAVVPISFWWLAAAVVVCSGIGAAIGAIPPVNDARAANLVDTYYALKDRAVTALQFVDSSERVRQLQVADAERHLQQVRAVDCVPIQPNRTVVHSGLVMATLSVAILTFGNFNRGDAFDARPVLLAAEQASSLRQTMLEEIEQLKQDDVDNPELDELTKKLADLVEELEEKSIDEADMMATLSEMEQAIAEARDSMQLEMTDAQMKGLAEALTPSEMMKQAAAAMEAGDYDKASEKLETIDPNQISDKERRAVADNLKKFLAKLSPGEQGQLSAAAAELQEGLEKQNESQCKSGLRKLATQCKKQGNCKKIGECMASQLSRLGKCKSECAGQCAKPGSKAAKTQSPSQKWGLGKTGSANDGESTKLDSNRREEHISGVQGDGPSESEVIEAPEGEQDAARQFARRYEKFRAQAEAVLDSEPLPLGHRETVREYFESIRPGEESK